MYSHIDTIIISALISALFVMLWQKFSAVDKRFDAADKNAKEGFAAVDKRFDKTDGKIQVIESDLKQWDRLSGKLEGRVDEISQRVK